MRRISLAVSVCSISYLFSANLAFAQGIGEMGGAYGISAGQAAGLNNPGATGALTNTFGAASKSMGASVDNANNSRTNNYATTGQPATGLMSSGKAKKGAGPAKKAAMRDPDEPLSAAEIAKNATTLSNKYFAESQKALKANNLDQADALLRQAINCRESLWGAKDPSVAKLYVLLGDMNSKQAPLRAEEAYHKAMMCLIKINGPGDYVMTPVLDKLGAAEMKAGKFRDAVNAYEQLYQLRSRKLGEDDKGTIQAAINLGKAYVVDEEFRSADGLMTTYCMKLDKGPDVDLESLAAALDIHQAALAKLNKPDQLARVQQRAKEVQDLISARPKPGSPPSEPSSAPAADTTSGAAADKSGAAPQSVPAKAPGAKADASNGSPVQVASASAPERPPQERPPEVAPEKPATAPTQEISPSLAAFRAANAGPPQTMDSAAATAKPEPPKDKPKPAGFDAAAKLYNQKKWGAAQKEFEKFINNGTADIPTHLSLAYCLYYQRQYTKALKQFDWVSKNGSVNRNAQNTAASTARTLRCYMQGICPADCLKPRDSRWHTLPGHPPGELWATFPDGVSYSTHHLGDVIRMVNGHSTDIGACPVCGGSGTVPVLKDGAPLPNE
jgi:tetratricopeptide (TPR) repeat protein